MVAPGTDIDRVIQRGYHPVDRAAPARLQSLLPARNATHRAIVTAATRSRLLHLVRPRQSRFPGRLVLLLGHFLLKRVEMGLHYLDELRHAPR